VGCRDVPLHLAFGALGEKPTSTQELCSCDLQSSLSSGKLIRLPLKSQKGGPSIIATELPHLPAQVTQQHFARFQASQSIQSVP
jgi:hypothetical protein